MEKYKDIVKRRRPEIIERLKIYDSWVFNLEWGVGKETHIMIKKVNRLDDQWYEVRVQSDHVFTCQCPTIDRAIEFADIYEDLLYTLYIKRGWPSWKSQSEP